MSIVGPIIKAALDALLGKLGTVFPWLRGWLDRPVIVAGRQRNWWFMGSTLNAYIDLDRVASMARLSPLHFLRVFAQLLGVTPHVCLRAGSVAPPVTTARLSKNGSPKVRSIVAIHKEIMYDHIGLQVRNLYASQRFYAAVLAPLGHVADASGTGFGPEGAPALWLYAGERDSATHIAFRAPSRAAVDRFVNRPRM